MRHRAAAASPLDAAQGGRRFASRCGRRFASRCGRRFASRCGHRFASGFFARLRPTASTALRGIDPADAVAFSVSAPGVFLAPRAPSAPAPLPTLVSARLASIRPVASAPPTGQACWRYRTRDATSHTRWARAIQDARGCRRACSQRPGAGWGYTRRRSGLASAKETCHADHSSESIDRPLRSFDHARLSLSLLCRFRNSFISRLMKGAFLESR